MEACRRVVPGKEADFVKELAEMAHLTLYDLRMILAVIPVEWGKRLSFKTALGNMLKSFCRRFCSEIEVERHYGGFPFKAASELSGLDQGEFIEVVLSTLGQTPELFGASRLFSLVGLLAAKLSTREAAESLSFGLDLFDGVLESTDGDGPWSSALEPPADLEQSIVGYIWAALASPKATVRWEAAHVVRGLCTIDRQTALAHLLAFARQGVGGPFVDARLPFYGLHARQWLLIALARVAKERPIILVPHEKFLIDAALNSPPHVLMREFAAKAAIALSDSGALRIEPDTRQRLGVVNEPHLSPAVARSGVFLKRATSAEEEEEEKEERYYFGSDIGPYWLEPLGDCFRVSQAQIVRAAKQVIHLDWKIVRGANRWDEDQRARRGLYRDSDATHSHGSYPRTDNLNFYLSYHAMMIVAGELLETTTPIHDADESVDRFTSWLDRHGLSHPDGNWLADRRDAPPLERPDWRSSDENDEWRWSIERRDFDEILRPVEGCFTVWGVGLFRRGLDRRMLT